MGKHNLRRIVNLQKWEPMIKKENKEQGGCLSLKGGKEGRVITSLPIPPCLSPESLKRDLEQLEQLKYRKLK